MENQEIWNPEPERETETEPESEQQPLGNTETSSAMKSFSLVNSQLRLLHF